MTVRNETTRIASLNHEKQIGAFWRAILRIGLACALVLPAFAQSNTPSTPANQNAADTAGSQRPINVLILGDSLSLCGFGKRLDERFRKDPRVNSTFTYMACGTTPLSWLKEKPYANIKTRCGFWTIESVSGSDLPRETQDTYGMRRKYSPKPHPVPKLEDLLAAVQPDILVMQTGTNLFDLFAGRKTIRGERDASALKRFLNPFLTKAITIPSSLRRIYWVTSPTSGRVSKEIQDFVFDQTRTDLGAVATVIDSRTLVSYPYHHMEPDREHFIGADMDQWADGVFSRIERDLSSEPLASLKLLSETMPAAAPPESQPLPEKPKSEPIAVKARLVFKTRPIGLRQLHPYQELLVAFVYDVRKVLAGHYTERQVLVMHPAYIALQHQPLDKYRVGRIYRLHLQELRGSAWETAKSRDDSGLIDLQPYIRTEDEARYPGATH